MSDSKLDRDFCFKFLAIRSHHSNRPFYLATVPFRVLSRLINFDTGNVLERSQRKTDPGRAKAILRYIKQNANNGFVLPPILGNIDYGGMEFVELIEKSNCGSLFVQMDAQIKLLDGQHRATAILAALKEMPELTQNNIAMQIYYGLSLDERQQAFSDINSNAKPVSRSLNLAYNHRDSLIKGISDEVIKVRAWEGKIDRDRNAANHKLGSLFSFKHVVAASSLLLGLKKGESPTENELMFVSSWWNAISAAVGWEDNEIDQEKVTNTAVGLMALARLGNKVREAEKMPDSNISKFDVAGRMFEIDWRKSAELWQGVLVQNEKMIVGKAAEEAAADLLAIITKVNIGGAA